MANNYKANPLVIDTAMATAFSAQAGVHTPVRVKKVYWFNPTASGDTFVIDDGSSSANVLLRGRAEAANQSQVFDFHRPVTWKDFKVGTLSAGGTLLIYRA